MRVVAGFCALLAVGAMFLAIRGMVVGQDARTGWLLRVVALAAFAAAVVLNAASR